MQIDSVMRVSSHRFQTKVTISVPLRCSAHPQRSLHCNGQNSFSLREFSQRFAEPVNRSSHVPVQRGERGGPPREKGLDTCGHSTPPGLLWAKFLRRLTPISLRLCGHPRSLRPPRFRWDQPLPHTAVGSSRYRPDSTAFGCGQRLLCVFKGPIVPATRVCTTPVALAPRLA
jgi:hypothetical protein